MHQSLVSLQKEWREENIKWTGGEIGRENKKMLNIKKKNHQQQKIEKETNCWKNCLEGKSVEVERKEEIQHNMYKSETSKPSFQLG